MPYATRNPSRNTALFAVALLGVGGAWFASRSRSRNELIEKLESSPAVARARALVETDPEKFHGSWLLDPQGVKRKATEALSLTGAASANAAFEEVLQSLPHETKGLLSQGGDFAREAAEAAGLAPVSDLMAWWYDDPSPEAKGNPDLGWDAFLKGGL